jgi:hypothetical protein
MARFSKRRQAGPGDTDRRSAVVIGRWADDAALLRVADGTTLEVTIPEPLRAAIDVGSRATVGPQDGDDVRWEAEEKQRFRRSRFWQRSRA